MTSGHLFPVVEVSAVRGLSLVPSHLTAMGEADLPVHFTMRSCRVAGSLSESLAVATVDEIMKLGGLKTASVVAHNVGPAPSGAAKGERWKLIEIIAIALRWTRSRCRRVLRTR